MMMVVLNLRVLSVAALAFAGSLQGEGQLGAAEPTRSEQHSFQYAGPSAPGRSTVTDSSQLKLVRLAGNGASAVFGEAIAPKVRVENRGAPVAGATVRFAILSGAGTLADTLVTTAEDGTATALWLPGAIAGEQRLRASVPGAELEFTAKVAELVPGKSYFGRNKYVEYIPGELPIILSSPHAGLLRPEEIPNRESGVTVRDGEIHDLALRTAAELEKLTGKRPHVVLMHLRRIKLDPNRAIAEAAQGSPFAERAWYEYHGWIETASALVSNTTGRGFYIDLHGHGHKEQRLELGYLLSARELALADEQVNKSQYVNKSSIRTLASNTPGGLAELLRGENSFGEILVRHGYRAVPSKSEPNPAGQPYFNGGYSTVRHGSRSGGVIDGVQIEHNSQGVRNSPANRAAYSRALAESILEYLETQMGLQLRQPAR